MCLNHNILCIAHIYVYIDIVLLSDWWWKARLGKCYYQLGLYRDAEKQFKSALRQQDMIITYLELSKIYLRLDQPNTALDNYKKAAEKFNGIYPLCAFICSFPHIKLLIAVHLLIKPVLLLLLLSALAHYKKVLIYDASSAEALACLASHHFYTDQPEIALRYYRRLLQMGVNNTELWNNLGLCCFYASQVHSRSLVAHCYADRVYLL